MKRLLLILGLIAAVLLAYKLGQGRGERTQTKTPNTPPPRVSTSQQLLTPALAAVLTPDPTNLLDRLEHLRHLPKGLTLADRAALLKTITAPQLPGLTADDSYALANDLIYTLRLQHPPEKQLTPALIALWNDTHADPTLRDYALQHLREWITDGDTRTAQEPDPANIKKIQTTFIEALTPGHPTHDPTSTSLGTALLALNEWTPQGRDRSPSGPVENAPAPSQNPQPSPQALSPDSSPDFKTFRPLDLQTLQTKLATLASPTYHRGTRATSIQIAAQRKFPDLLPTARALLADPATDLILQLAAISYLGTTGTAQDHTLLKSLQTQSNPSPLLQPALTKALQGTQGRDCSPSSPVENAPVPSPNLQPSPQSPQPSPPDTPSQKK